MMLHETTIIEHGASDGFPISEKHLDTGGQRRPVRTSGLFRGLSEDQCGEILSCAVLHRFKIGDFLFVQGEPVRHLIWLQSGMVKHTQVTSDGKEVLVRINSCGDVISVHGMLSSCLHTCSGRAMEKGEALIWENGQIERFCTRYPQFRSNFNRLLVIQLEDLEERFREMATETVARRLALLLVRLSNQVGRRSIHGPRVSISREELAQMSGTTVYTISRLLVRWAQQGFLLLAGKKKIVVTDTKKLEAVKAVEIFR